MTNMASDKKQYLMALDAGTGAGRCYVISIESQESFDTYQEWQYDFPLDAQPGGMEFNPEKFWKIFSTLIMRMLKEHQIDPKQIRAISSSSQREGFVLLDKKGQELYAGPNVDIRSPSNGEAITEKFGEELYQISGHWPIPMFAPYRLLWLKENKKELFDSADSLLMINDWILYRLCGEKCSEPSNAVETLLFDLKHGKWAWEMINKLGLPSFLFQPVKPSGTVMGYVSEKAAEETGLMVGTPVVVGGADTQCGVLGTGSMHDGQVSTICGTYAQSVMVLDQPIIDGRYRSWSGCHAAPRKWVLESTAMETGQAFRYVRDLFYGDDKINTYSKMDDEAYLSPPGAHGVQSFIGPRVPNYRDLRFITRGAFYIQLPPVPSSGSRADFARAVLESSAFGIKANIERLSSISEKYPSELNICGGMSKSRTFQEVLANTLNIPVNVLKEKEGTALGASICAAVGSGVFNSFEEAAKELIRNEKTVYENGLAKQYDEFYQHWLKNMYIAYEEGIGEIK